MRSMKATAPNKTSNVVSTFPVLCSRSGIRVQPVPMKFPGFAFSIRACRSSISLRACSNETPCFTRPMTCQSCQPRACRISAERANGSHNSGVGLKNMPPRNAPVPPGYENPTGIIPMIVYELPSSEMVFPRIFLSEPNRLCQRP